ncbi:MAG: HupE/UreJ family protein [Limnohabitans sp.]
MNLFSNIFRLLVTSFFSLSLSTFAHQTGNSYLTITEKQSQLQIDLDFIVRDLDNLLQSPTLTDTPVPVPTAAATPTPEQLLGLQPSITQVIQESLGVQLNEQAQTLAFVSQTVVLRNDGLYVRQRFVSTNIPSSIQFVVVRYSFFNQNDKLGRAFFKLQLGKDEISSVFDSSTPIQRFALGDSKRWSTIGLFTLEGAWHIWGGPDHLLFLLTLLLPGLMLLHRTTATSDTDAHGTQTAGLFALKVITAFTVAHSITLLASVLDVISLPSHWIESAIALSIMISAGLNLQSRIQWSQWKLALFFGLIHGMGFANGLRELGLSPTYFIETVLAFNIGVELGLIAAVLAVGIPIILMAKTAQFKQLFMTYGSWGVLLVSGMWLVQRLME